MQVRTLLVLLPVVVLGACKTLQVPIARDFRLLPKRSKVSLEPVAGAIELAGKAKMQSASAFGAVDNSYVGVESGLNMGDRDTAVGGTLSYGDGFSGISFGGIFFHSELVKTTGTLEDDFGALKGGDKIISKVDYTHLRFDWVLPILEARRIGDADLRLGAGISVQHDEFKLDARNDTKTRRQTLSFKDDFGVPKGLLRTEVEWTPFTLRLEGAAMNGDFGGLGGALLDFSISGRYRIQRGISAWAGYWRHNLPGQGTKDGLAFDFDMSIQGFMAGVRFEF